MENYKDWLLAVDSLIMIYIGLGVNDLEDYCYRDCFDNDYTPNEMLETLIEEGILPTL